MLHSLLGQALQAVVADVEVVEVREGAEATGEGLELVVGDVQCLES